MTTAMTNASRTITITDLDDVFVGQGIVTETGQIVDIAARLGETAEETERIYDAIESEIDRGMTSGITEGYKWELQPAWEVELWVSDQVTDNDETAIYLAAAMERGITLPDGVTLDTSRLTLSGTDPDSLWSAFVSLRAAVASVGHGQDLESRPIPGRPTLVAHQGRPEYPVRGPHDIR